MNPKIDIGNGITIELTNEQLESINRQQDKRPMIDRINNVNDALAVLQKDDEEVLDYQKMLSAGVKGGALHGQELVLMIKAVNDGWEADYLDRNQRKWFPVFETKPDSSFAFASSHFEYWYALAVGGSRLALKNEELSNKFGAKFSEKYKLFLMK